jgi:osmoprotectant transport system permease protein
MDQTLMYGAVSNKQVDAIIAYSSDGRIRRFGLRLLSDPEHVFPPYDAILLLSPAAARRPRLVEALRPLLGAIDQPTMQEANARVDVERHSPRRAADWLLRTIEGGKRP